MRAGKQAGDRGTAIGGGRWATRRASGPRAALRQSNEQYCPYRGVRCIEWIRMLRLPHLVHARSGATRAIAIYIPKIGEEHSGPFRSGRNSGT